MWSDFGRVMVTLDLKLINPFAPEIFRPFKLQEEDVFLCGRVTKRRVKLTMLAIRVVNLTI